MCLRNLIVFFQLVLDQDYRFLNVPTNFEFNCAAL